MARPKKGQASKADAIREILKGDPRAKTADVVTQLAGKGIKVSANHVYLINSKAAGRKRRQRREAAVEATQRKGVTNPVQAIVRVRSLAGDLGGMKSLKQLVDALIG